MNAPAESPRPTRSTASGTRTRGRAFADEPAGVLPTDEEGLTAILCRSVATDLAAPYLDDFPDVAKYRDLLEALRLSG